MAVALTDLSSPKEGKLETGSAPLAMMTSSSIGEKQEAILRRRDLINVTQMERNWTRLEFVYQGQHHKNSSPIENETAVAAGLSAFSWTLVTIIAALDLCLPSAGIKSLVRKVYSRVLDGDEEQENSMRVLLTGSIESWRETGCVRGINRVMARTVRDCRLKHHEGDAVPQLNSAEAQEMEEFLVWLLKGESFTFKAMSIVVFSAAVRMGMVGVKVRTEGLTTYEAEPVVRYIDEASHLNLAVDFLSTRHGGGRAAQQISYPRDKPSTMIHSIPTSRETVISMTNLWDLGSDAASKMALDAEAEFPYTQDSEIYYVLKTVDKGQSNFGKEVIMLAGRAFPERSEGVLLAVEELAKGIKAEQLAWLLQRTELGFLKRARDPIVDETDKNVSLWLKYQALVFGFYYGLLSQLVSFELLQEGDTYLKGLWGYGSTVFLAMCVEFGDIMRSYGKISRSHLLYMLSTMYAGRDKLFSTLSTGKGLLGILGPISVLTRPLLRTTDIPSEIASFMIVDLPILDLAPDAQGELFASTGGGVDFNSRPVSQDCLKARGQTKTWRIHTKMGVLFGDGMPGVVMAARCGGRLIGWFNPMAADVAFLSTAYQQSRCDREPDYVDLFDFTGFEVHDADWQSGCLPRPAADEGRQVGIIHSKDCPALRYAAAGIYAEIGDEIAIVTDDLEVAHGRVDGQGGGLIIS